MNADGSDPHRFVNDPAAAWEGVPSVSPDGDGSRSGESSTTVTIAVVRADGTGPVIRTGPELTSVAHWNLVA